MKQPVSSRFASALINALLLAVLAVPAAAQQAEDTGAKSLFYDPAAKRFWPPEMKKTPLAKAPATKAPVNAATRTRVRQPVTPLPAGTVARYPGIHYWVELKGRCVVTEEQTFYTGDQVQFHVRSNVDGYLSLWALGAAGQSQRLFPPLDQPQLDNFVRAGVEYAPKGSIVFRPPAEDERLVVFFSRSKTEVPMQAPGEIASGGKALSFETPGGAQQGGKEIVFEVEKKDSQTCGSYLVNREGGSVQREIRLKHQPRGNAQ